MLSALSQRNYYNKKIKVIIYLVIIFTGFIAFSHTNKVYAATCDWTDAVTNNSWNTAGNWSCGAVPGSADTAVFDSTSSNANATINATVNVAGFTMQNSYSGTITQGTNTITVGATGWTQSSGTFTGGSVSITLTGTFSLSGGIFTSTSGTLKEENTWTINGGIFNNNSGTVAFDTNGFTITGSSTFYNLTFDNPTSGFSTITVASGTTLTATGTLTDDDNGGGSPTLNGPGTITAQGNITELNRGWLGNIIVTLSGSAAQTITGVSSATSTVNSHQGMWGLTINKSAGTASFVNTMNILSNWTYIAGTLNFGTSTIYFTETSTLTGSTMFNNLGFNLKSGVRTATIASGTTLTAAGNLMLNSDSNGNCRFAGSGGLAAQSDITVSGGGCGGTNTLTINGTGTQTLTGTNDTNGNVPSIIINKASGTLNLVNQIVVYGNWTYVSGTVSAGTSTVNFSYPQNGTQTISGSVSLYNVSFTQAYGVNGRDGTDTLTSGSTLTVTGTLILANDGSTALLNGPGNIVSQGNITSANQGTGGNIAISLSGTGNQTLTQAASTFFPTGTITINKPSGTVTLGANLNLLGSNQALLISSGKLDMANYNLTVNGLLSVGGALHQGGIGTLNFGSMIISTTGSFVEIGNGIVIAGGSITNNGYMRIDGGNVGCGDTMSYATLSSPSSSSIGITSTSGASADSGDSNDIGGSPFNSGTGGTVVSMSGYVNSVDSSPHNEYQMAIYDSSGNLVAKSGIGTLTANSWNTIAISATLAANTTYFLVYNTNGTSTNYNNLDYLSSGNYISSPQTFGTWPSSISTTEYPDTYVIYASYSGTQQSISGSGKFRIYDTSISDMSPTSAITAYNSTNIANNGINLTFTSSCPSEVTWTDNGGGGDGNWNTSTNWSGGAVPTSTQMAIFDDTADNNNTINANIDVGGVEVDVGYPGTITQSSTYIVTVESTGWTQNSGTFLGGSGSITFNGSFTLTNASYTATSGTLIAKGNWKISSSTFSNNSGTIDFEIPQFATDTITGSVTFYNAIFGYSINCPSTVQIASGTNITVNQTLTLASDISCLRGNNHPINGPGTITALGNIAMSGNGDEGAAVITVSGTANQTITGSGSGFLPALTINKTGGTLTLANTITLTSNLTYTQGSVNPGTSTVVFSAFQGATLYISGSLTLYNASFGDSVNCPAYMQVNSGTILTVDGKLTLQSVNCGANTHSLNGPGTINLLGNLSTTSGGDIGNISITMSGTTAQTITQSGAYFPTGTLTINKPSGIVSLGTNLNLSALGQALLIPSGTLSIGTYNLTVNGLLSIGGTLNQSSGTVNAGSYILSPGSYWYDTTGGGIVIGSGGVTNYGNFNIGSAQTCSSGFSTATITSSTSGTAQTWTGPGSYDFYNITVKDQNENPYRGGITAWNSTNNGNTNFIVKSGCPSPPSMYWKFDEGNGSTAHDSGILSNQKSSINFIQGSHGDAVNGPLNVAFPSNVAAGNFIVVEARSAGTTDSVSDNQGDTFNAADSWQINPGGSYGRIFYAMNVRGGATTVTLSGSDSWLGLSIAEFSGVATTNALDGTIHGTSSGTSSTITGPSFTPSSGDLVFAGEGDTSSFSSYTPTSPWSDGPSHQLTDGQSNQSGSAEYIVNASPIATQSGWSLSTSVNYNLGYAAFKPQVGVNGTLSGTTLPTWQTEDQCVFGKCLYFDGSSSKVVGSSVVNSIQTVSFWVRPISVSSPTLMNLDGGTHEITVSNGTISAPGFSSPTIYVNGAVSSTLQTNIWQLVTVTTSTPFNSANIVLGTDGTHFTNGFFDEVKIYNYTKTLAQIDSDYNGGEDLIGNSALLGKESNNYLNKGLVGYWKMDEASWNGTAGEVKDSSGNGNNGTANGSTITVGKFGNGGSFSPTSSTYINIPPSSSFDSVTSSITVSAWVYATNFINGDWSRIIENASTTDWTIENDGNSPGKLFFGANATQYGFSTTTLQTNTWYFVTMVAGDSSVSLYINGKLDSTVAFNNTVSSITGVHIGGDTVTTNNIWNGTIDEARIYNLALSPDEVSQLYNFAPGPIGYWKFDEGTGSTVTDSSGYGNNGTLTNSPVWTTGKYGSAVTFSTAKSQIASISDSSSINLTSSHTVEAWVNIVSYGTFQYIVDKGNQLYGMYIDSSGHVVEVYNNVSLTASTNTIPLNTWTHITVAYDGSTFTTYINGVIDHTQAILVTISTDANPLSIGSGSGGGDTFIQTIDDVKVYNYARTLQQITEDMNASHPAGGSPIGSQVGYWKFDEGYGSVVHNSGNQGPSLDGTWQGTLGSQWTNAAKFGKAGNFNGTNNYVNMGDPAGLQITGALTLSGWINLTNNTTSHEILAKSGTSNLEYELFISNLGKLAFGVTANGTTETLVTGVTTLLNSNWYHVTGTYIPGRSLTVYVNGIQDGENTTSIPSSIFNSTDNMEVGAGHGTLFFAGQIDEMKVYSSALTQQQILIDMNRNSSEVLGALSDSTSGNQVNSTASQYCIPGDSSTCSAPVGEWNFEEHTGTTAYDTSGNGLNGIFAGGANPIWRSGAPCKVGSCLEFNSSKSTSEYVSVNDNTKLDIPDNISIETWFYPIAYPTVYAAHPINKYTDITDANYDMYFWGTSAGGGNAKQIAFYATAGGNWSLLSPTYTITNLKTMYHIVWTYNSTAGGKLYINGSLVGSVAGAGTLATNTRPLIIGDDVVANDPVDFALDSTKIYNYVRTPAQVDWDYDRGAPVAYWKMDECQGTTIHDSSGNGNTGTLNIGLSGTQTTPGSCSISNPAAAWSNGKVGKFNSSINLDGTDDYVDVGKTSSENIYGPITESAWIKPTSADLDGNYHDVMTNCDSTGNTCQYGFGIHNSHIEYYVCNAGCNNVDTTATLNSGVWYHIVATSNGGNPAQVVIYINGIKQTTTGSINLSLPISGFGNTAIGRAGSYNGQYFAGQIDDVRLYNYILTSVQVRNLYNGGSSVFFGPSTGSP